MTYRKVPIKQEDFQVGDFVQFEGEDLPDDPPGGQMFEVVAKNDWGVMVVEPGNKVKSRGSRFVMFDRFKPFMFVSESV